MSAEKPSPAVLFHNPRCSKSREALALLESRGVEFEVVDYLQNPPSFRAIRALIHKLEAAGERPFALLRTKEPEFAQVALAEDASADDVARALEQHPVLLERPVLVVGERAAIGRPLETLEALIS